MEVESHVHVSRSTSFCCCFCCCCGKAKKGFQCQVNIHTVPIVKNICDQIWQNYATFAKNNSMGQLDLHPKQMISH